MAWKDTLRLEIPPAGLRGAQGDGSGVAQPFWSSIRQPYGAQLEAAGWLCCPGPAKRVFRCCVATRECTVSLFGEVAGFFWGGVVLVWTLFILWGFFLFIFLFLFCFCCWDYGGFFWLEDLPFS